VNSPSLSIILVFHNQKELAEQTLTVLYEQLSIPFELFVADNASHDGTTDVIRSVVSHFGHEETYFFEHSEYRGRGPAVQELLSQCNGKILWMPLSLRSVDGGAMASQIQALLHTGALFGVSGMLRWPKDVRQWSEVFSNDYDLSVSGLPCDTHVLVNLPRIPSRSRFVNPYLNNWLVLEWMVRMAFDPHPLGESVIGVYEAGMLFHAAEDYIVQGGYNAPSKDVYGAIIELQATLKRCNADKSGFRAVIPPGFASPEGEGKGGESFSLKVIRRAKSLISDALLPERARSTRSDLDKGLMDSQTGAGAGFGADTFLTPGDSGEQSLSEGDDSIPDFDDFDDSVASSGKHFSDSFNALAKYTSAINEEAGVEPGDNLGQPEHELPQSDSHELTEPELPQSGSEQPQSGSELPQSGSEQLQSGSELPQSGSELPQSGSELPQSGSELPQSGSELPQSGSELPQSDSHGQPESELPQSGSEQLQSGSELPQSDSHWQPDKTTPLSTFLDDVKTRILPFVSSRNKVKDFVEPGTSEVARAIKPHVDFMVHEGEFPDALKLVNEAIDVNPEDVDLIHVKVRLLQRMRRYVEAAELKHLLRLKSSGQQTVTIRREKIVIVDPSEDTSVPARIDDQDKPYAVRPVAGGSDAGVVHTTADSNRTTTEQGQRLSTQSGKGVLPKGNVTGATDSGLRPQGVSKPVRRINMVLGGEDLPADFDLYKAPVFESEPTESRRSPSRRSPSRRSPSRRSPSRRSPSRECPILLRPNR
jgi:hypothetical protein